MIFKNYERISHAVSKLFQPVNVVPKGATVKHQDITSISQKLMLDLGIIKQASPGSFHLLPLAVRSLEKLIKLVDQEMKKVDGQKIIFPTLTNSKLWKATGRLSSVSSELFQVKDRHGQNYVLSPTHEEAASDLLASIAPVSYKQLPLKLYQITSKFRDEMKPRFGLIRGKQFIMKDLYSFDADVRSAEETYLKISEAYNQIFTKIGINFVRVQGDPGSMGGSLSHEYHYQSKIGEDKIISCSNCGYLANFELSKTENCTNCGDKNVDISPAIEVGHTFLLGDKYSKPLKALYLDKNGKDKVLQMGSYGLGLSRILAAAVEVLSLDDYLRWPAALAPFSVIIIPPKGGSKEELHLTDSSVIENLYEQIEAKCNMEDDVLLDDRTSLTIGRRYLDAKRVGYPYIIVVGNKITNNPPLYELTDLRNDKQMYLNQNDLLNYIKTSIHVSKNEVQTQVCS